MDLIRASMGEIKIKIKRIKASSFIENI